MKAADTTAEKRRLKIKREDLMRLRRIEQIYVCSQCILCVCTLCDEVYRALFFLCCLIGCLSCLSFSWPSYLRLLRVSRQHPPIQQASRLEYLHVSTV